MAQAKNEDLTVVTFRNEALPNENLSREKGRPMFDDLEICEIRFAGDTKRVCVFPAMEAEPNETREKGFPVSYAEVYSEQYRKFKSQEQQTVAGTPLSEAPFLTEAKRRELRALNIHSVEALAMLDGPNLKMLGMGGREWKNQAQAFLDAAEGSADVTALQAQIDALKDSLAIALANPAPKAVVTPPKQEKTLDECTDEELHAFIKEESGRAMPANTGRAKLIERATELAQAEAA